MKRTSTCFAALMGLLALAGGSWARGDDLYQTDFDALTPGLIAPLPGEPGQDGWYDILSEGDAYSEIQDTVANGGQALHLHTAATVPPALQTIAVRDLAPVALAGIRLVTLSVDFYASTSDLGGVNNLIAGLGASGADDRGLSILGFVLSSGNGSVKGDVGVSVGLSYFNGSDNNERIPLTVGKEMAWDAWHSITLVIDRVSDTWVSATVDGQTESLLGYTLARGFQDPAVPTRGSLIDRIDTYLIPDDVGGDRSDDDVYFDNLRLTVEAVPEPSSAVLLLGGIGVLTAAGLRSRRAAGDH